MRTTTLLFLLSLLGFAACQHSEHQHQQNNTADASQEPAHKVVSLTARQRQALDLKLITPKKRPMGQAIRTTGEISTLPTRTARLSPYQGGNVTDIRVIPGENVEKGEVLIRLKHPQYLELQRQYREVMAALPALKQEMQRQKNLYKKEVSSGQKYQQAKAAYQEKQARGEGLAQHLRVMGYNPEQVAEGHFSSSLSLRAPFSGYVQKIHVGIGEYLSSDKTALTMLNREHLHAHLGVYEKDAAKVEKGMKVRLNSPSLPDNLLKGHVYKVSPQFEQGSQQLSLHAHLESAPDSLMPGLYLEGFVLSDSIRVLTLPEEAVLQKGPSHIVFIKEKNQEGETWHFRPLEVRKLQNRNGFTAFRPMEALPADARIVGNGAYYLLAKMEQATQASGGGGHSH